MAASEEVTECMRETDSVERYPGNGYGWESLVRREWKERMVV